MLTELNYLIKYLIASLVLTSDTQSMFIKVCSFFYLVFLLSIIDENYFEEQ